jgi:hypothetical protein
MLRHMWYTERKQGTIGPEKSDEIEWEWILDPRRPGFGQAMISVVSLLLVVVIASSRHSHSCRLCYVANAAAEILEFI